MYYLLELVVIIIIGGSLLLFLLFLLLHHLLRSVRFLLWLTCIVASDLNEVLIVVVIQCC